jgi:HAD superfamily hydrolase (TIGR01509 family)
MPQVIFWDNDGVLVDTEPLFFRATAEVLAEYGVTLTEARFKEVSLGQGKSIFDALGEDVSQGERAALRDRRNSLFAEHLARGGHLIDGVAEVLAELAPDYRMAVVTSCKREHFDAVHGDTQVRDYFEFVLALEDYPRTKPRPDPYLAALTRAGVRACEAIAIEDSPRGVRAAVAAHIPCIAIPRGLTRDGDFSGAWIRLESVVDVPGVLRQANAVWKPKLT